MIGSMKSRAGIWIAFGVAFALPLTADLVYFVLPPNSTVARWGYGATKVFLLTWPLICICFLLPAKPKADVRFKRRPWWSLGVGTALGLAIAGGIVGLMQTPLEELVREGSPVVREKMRILGWSENFVYWAFGISLIHSALEEYYWRWFGYGRLARFWPGMGAHLAAAAAFSLHHYVILWVYFSPGLALWLGTMVALGGFLWSQLYQRTGSLLGPWASHVFADLAIFWVGWRMMNGA